MYDIQYLSYVMKGVSVSHKSIPLMITDRCSSTPNAKMFCWGGLSLGAFRGTGWCLLGSCGSGSRGVDPRSPGDSGGALGRGFPGRGQLLGYSVTTSHACVYRYSSSCNKVCLME